MSGKSMGLRNDSITDEMNIRKGDIAQNSTQFAQIMGGYRAFNVMVWVYDLLHLFG